MEAAGPPGTPLGMAQRKRASARGEAGTSGFLSISDSDRRVPAELRQESHASSCLRKGTPLASRVAQGFSGPWSSCVWNPQVFPDDARGCQCPFVLCTCFHLHHTRFLCGKVVLHFLMWLELCQESRLVWCFFSCDSNCL